MSDSIFPSRWAPEDPAIIQLYSLATPNGKKASIALEELGLEYEAHTVNIMEDEQFDPEYIEINPNSKIPTLVDPNGPDGEPLAIFESGAILHYLAKKTQKLMPLDPRGESEVLQWLFFQAASVGPMFGQFGHFYKFAADKTDDYGQERYAKESKRLLGVLDSRLEDRDWLCGEYSMADIMTAPWCGCFDFYGGHELVGFDEFENVHAWLARFNDRPAVTRGSEVCGF